MIQKVGLVVPDAAQVLIDAGKLVRTDGILRNAETMEIVKHLDIIDLEDTSAIQEFAVALKRLIKENKVAFAVGTGVLVGVGVVVGVISHNKKKEQKKTEEKYNAWLNSTIKTYLDSAKSGNLDINTIEDCEAALLSLPKMTEKVFISMTKDQILDFVNCLKDYTLQLAEKNDYVIEDIDALQYSDNVVSFMLRVLDTQKDILKKSA